MKYLTKENILLAMVGFLFLVQVNDMRKARGRSGSPRGAIMERMRGMERGAWGSRMEGMRKAREGKAEDAAIQTGSFDFFLKGPAPLSLSPGVTCCDQKLPCCDHKN